jgi:hypothetical protein
LRRISIAVGGRRVPAFTREICESGVGLFHKMKKCSTDRRSDFERLFFAEFFMLDVSDGVAQLPPLFVSPSHTAKNYENRSERMTPFYGAPIGSQTMLPG